MGLNDMLSETHAKHTEMKKEANHSDVLRLIAEGKRPASQEENERPVGENGKPLEKLQLVPERDILRGGMPRWWKRDDQASTSTSTRAEDVARMSPNKQVRWCVRGGLAEAFRPDGNRTLRPVIMDILKNDQIRPSMRSDIAKDILALNPGVESIPEMLQIIKIFRNDSYISKDVTKAILDVKPGPEFIPDMLQIIKDNQIDSFASIGVTKAILDAKPGPEFIPDMLQIAKNNQIDDSVRICISKAILDAKPGPEVILNMMQMSKDNQIHSEMQYSIAKAILDAKPGPEYIHDMLQMVKSHQIKPSARRYIAKAILDAKPGPEFIEEYAQMQERERKLQQDAEQRLQRAIQAEQQKLQMERKRFQRQLKEAQLERDRAQAQLREAQLERNQRGQSSRGELRRGNDALPTSREGLQKQLERERRTPQESRERVQQLRERIQRNIWERGDQPPNVRLNEWLKYPIEGVLEDHQLVEQIYPLHDQPAQHRQALRQSLNKALRKRLMDLYANALAEYTPSGLPRNEIAGEFLNQLQEQMEEHHRPNQEWLDASEDIQQKVTGSRPRR